jgi:hypothetical protein
MAVFPHPGWWLGVPTQQSRKISIPLINNPPGNYCLVPGSDRSEPGTSLLF